MKNFKMLPKMLSLSGLLFTVAACGQDGSGPQPPEVFGEQTLTEWFADEGVAAFEGMVDEMELADSFADVGDWASAAVVLAVAATNLGDIASGAPDPANPDELQIVKVFDYCVEALERLSVLNLSIDNDTVTMEIVEAASSSSDKCTNVLEQVIQQVGVG